jgi:drug/metabolite transporter (DMT)-like permease
MQRAVFIMFIAMSLIPAGDTAGKLLSSQLSVAPLFVAWSRFVLGAVLVLPFMPAGTMRLLRNWRIWVRAAILACGISFMQKALQTTDIATVFAAFFIGPMFSFVLAAIFLKEHVTFMRSTLILLGFAGVLLVVRPGGAETGVLWAVAAGLAYGTFLTMSRALSHLGVPLSLTFTQLLIAGILLTPFGVSQLPPATLTIAGLTFASALCSMLGNLLLLYAYRIAPATKLAPLVYFQLIAAVALGWAVFAELPDTYTWAGLAVIITAGLASAHLR